MSIIKRQLPTESTVENLINNLDNRGILVFLVLLGQQAMKILTEEKTKEHSTKNTILSNLVT